MSKKNTPKIPTIQKEAGTLKVKSRRSNPPLSPSVLSGSEPDRTVLFQTQGAAPQSRTTRHRRPLEGNRGVAQYSLPQRMHKLLCLLWICKHLNQNRSRSQEYECLREWKAVVGGRAL